MSLYGNRQTTDFLQIGLDGEEVCLTRQFAKDVVSLLRILCMSLWIACILVKSATHSPSSEIEISLHFGFKGVNVGELEMHRQRQCGLGL